MPNLKDIKQRIKSIHNTQKITQAMKMVAAAKVKKAENAVKSARPYSQSLKDSFSKVLKSSPSFDSSELKFSHAIENYPALMKKREVNTVGLLVLTSDKGLAGAYNANIVRRAIARINELKSEGKQVKLFIVGQKGLVALRRFCSQNGVDVINSYTKLPPIISVVNANVIAEDVAKSYVSGEIDKSR
jgi:F-type H+-transporting ATPase subunit gamma